MELPRLQLQVQRIGPWLYAVFLAGVAILSNFAVLSNDSFPLVWQASHLSLRDPITLYNGFFPIGYPLMLRVVMLVTHNPFPLATLVQCGLGFAVARSVLASTAAMLRPGAALVASLLTLLSPLLVRSDLSVVPDMAAVLFALLAFETLLVRTERGWLRLGLLLGAGCMFRSHMLALVLALSVAMLISEGGVLRRVLVLWLGVAPFILIQGLVQVYSGHDFFESLHAFNIWKTMHGVDWPHPPVPFRLTAWQVVSEAPGLFVRATAGQLLDSAPLLLALLAPLLYNLSGKALPRPLQVLTVSGLLYLLLIAPGGSARGALLVLLPAMIALLYLLQEIVPTSTIVPRTRAAMVFAALVMTLAAAVAAAGYSAMRARHRIQRYAVLAQECGLTHAGDAAHVYTDDYALYFPNHDAATPATSGGWPAVGMPSWSAAEPRIVDTSSVEFYSSLQAAGIHWAVFREPPINLRAYTAAAADSFHFPPTASTTGYHVFKVR